MDKTPVGMDEATLVDVDGIQRSLRRADLRPTRARILVLRAFHHAPNRLQSRSDIVTQMLAQPSPLNVSTVYGTILELERRGFLSRTWTHDGKSLYWLSGARAVNTQLECSNCHRTWPLDDEDVLNSLQQMSRRRGLALASQPTRIQIVCSGCGGQGAEPAHWN